jgi:hypothetical protein
VARGRAPNPLAPLRPVQIRRQARAYVNAQIQPLLRQLNQRESGNLAAIGDYTQRLQQQLAPVAGQTAGYYNQAEQEQRSLNTELANRLGSVGGQEAAALQAKLAQAGIPAEQAQRVGAIGAGAANAGAALGSANLASLLASGAAQTAYAGKLPGIAALGGLQFAKQNLAQMQQNRGQLLAKVPSLISSYENQAQNLEFQKAAANLGFQGTQAKLQQQGAYQGARLGLTKRGQDITLRGQNIRATQQARKTQAAQSQKRETAFYSARKSAFSAAQRLYNGTGTSQSSGGGYQPPGAGTRASYGTAYRQLWATYGVPLTRHYGFKRSAVDTMIRRALKNAGYQRPLSNQQAAAQGAAAAAAIPGQIGF